MTFRGVWVIRREEGKADEVVFSRRFPTVERRAKLLPSHAELPPDGDFARQLGAEMDGKLTPDGETVPPDRADSAPVYALGGAGALWPVLAIEQASLAFACLPLVEDAAGAVGSSGARTVARVPAVTVGVALLKEIAQLCLAPGGAPLEPHAIRTGVSTCVVPCDRWA